MPTYNLKQLGEPAIKDASDWFAKHNRGRKLFMTPRILDSEIQISIRRGDPFSRKSTIDDDGSDTITFREARKDSMVYCLDDEVLMLNSSLKSAYSPDVVIDWLF